MKQNENSILKKSFSQLLGSLPPVCSRRALKHLKRRKELQRGSGEASLCHQNTAGGWEEPVSPALT